MYCPKCGSPNEKTAKFCIKCGERLQVSGQLEAKLPAPTRPPDAQQRQGPERPQPEVPGKAKSRPKLVFVILAVILVLLLILAAELVVLWTGWPDQTPMPATAETAPTIGTGQPEATISSAPTAAPSAGETAHLDEVEVSFDNPSFSPGCKGWLGFEVTLLNASETDVAGLHLSVTDNTGAQYPNIWWNEGRSSWACYRNSLDGSSLPSLEAHERTTLAFRVLGEPNPDASKFTVAIQAQDGRVRIGDWEVGIPATPTPVNCEVEKWEIVPTGVYEYPDSGGWKTVVVQIAVRNGSSYWGKLDIIRDTLREETVLTTEGGFRYGIRWGINDFYRLPSEPAGSPYSGAETVPSQISTTLLPPGFSYRGDDYPIGSHYTLGGTAKTWQQLVFQVPQTQKDFHVSIPSARITCITEDGNSGSSRKPPVNWDLDKDVRQVSFPTDRPSSDFQDYKGSTATKGQAIFMLTNASRADPWITIPGNEELDLFFSMQNINQGYDIEEGFQAYVIGDDGISRDHTWSRRAGPGQVVAGMMGYIIDPNVRNFKLVCYDTSASFFAIYNIPDEQ